jgi:uncharacterized membrane protein YedE/YeeE
MIEILQKPWPWYLSGLLIGLTVPTLLIIGNKNFGISSSLRHICAVCLPANIPFFNYNWRKEIWNLFFVAGVTIGGFITGQFLSSNEPIDLNPKTIATLEAQGIDYTDKTEYTAHSGSDHKLKYDVLMPSAIFNTDTIFTLTGFIFFVVGGFMIGFGTRYAGGCTSGHAIMGLSNLQWPSLVATCCFMAGGILMVNFILPAILKAIL